MLRLAVEGSRLDHGILASRYAQAWTGGQEIVSTGDNCCFDVTVGSADRYLIRGFSLLADMSSDRGGFFGLPFELHDSTDKLFTLTHTTAQGSLVVGPQSLTSPPGITEWAAPQGATVPGSSGYQLKMTIRPIPGDDFDDDNNNGEWDEGETSFTRGRRQSQSRLYCGSDTDPDIPLDHAVGARRHPRTE